ncbi:MAG: DNA-binding protein [Pirellulaceae bacterium]|nr:DNA-binding protein [Pirellulaceae bacterium]
MGIASWERHGIDNRDNRQVVSLKAHGTAPEFLSMSSELLSSEKAAQRLGITIPTLYDWLSRSDAGEFVIRGQSMSIAYLQGGRRGQGRIQIEVAEIERLQESMRVHPQPKRRRRQPVQLQEFPGITVPLGRPED